MNAPGLTTSSEVQFIRDAPPRVLLVAGEPLLQIVYRQRWFNNHDYIVSYASSAAEALVFLETYCADLLIVHANRNDRSLPGFLEQAAEICPESTRLILGDQRDRRIGFEAIASGVAHQFHCVEWQANALQDLIGRSFEVHRGLSERHLRALLSPFVRLPNNIASQFRLHKLLEEEDSSLNDLAHEIEKYPALVGKILQIANSVCYGLRRHVVSVSDAIVFIGLEHIGTMLVAIEMFSSVYKDLGEDARAHVDRLWERAIRRAHLARQIAERIGDEDLADRAFITAMFEDIGYLIRLTQQKARYGLMLRIAREGNVSMSDADHQCFVITHEELGSALLNLWNFPEDIVRNVLQHHRHHRDAPEIHRIITVAEHLEASHELAIHDQATKDLIESWREQLHPDHPPAQAGG